VNAQDRLAERFFAWPIHRPVATSLLTLAMTLLGLVAFQLLPVAPLPQVDFPSISVSANLPGASPETMAATVATPLERAFGTIAGISEMTSSSTLGNTRISLQFDLNRDINGAARDVQAAINAARTTLPTGLPNSPSYRKVNPADAPVMILALTSERYSRADMYDAASTLLAQKIAQIDGVGQVTVGGSSLPAVRVAVNAGELSALGLGMEDVRNAIVANNANRPKGFLENGVKHWQILANDQARTAAEYQPLLLAWKNGTGVRLADVAIVEDGAQDVRNMGLFNGKPAVILLITRQPGANIIETVGRIKGLLPMLRASIPAAMDLSEVMDRTPTIRASLREVERSLVLAVALVVMVVFIFLRNARAAFIPSVVVPVSLITTFAVMYLAGFSLNNISLMALTVATGFVVDDAVVVLENINRHLEQGMPPFEAAIKGVREVGFTVLAMSLSLVAVFIPILLMGGIVGRLFGEFAITLTAAIFVSLVVSLTMTPMLAARWLKPRPSTAVQEAALGLGVYRRSLDWALHHPRTILLVLIATIGLNLYLYAIVPKGFFPQQDTGRIMGFIQADQSISFQAMRGKLAQLMDIVQQDEAVKNVIGFTGGSQRNGGQMFVALKPLNERDVSLEQVVNRLRGKLSRVAGATLYLQGVQDIRMGGRPSNAQFQYAIQADSLEELRMWESNIRQSLKTLPQLTDVNTDQQDKGLQTSLVIDRDTMNRLGLNQKQVNATLNDLFGQRLVSTIYHPLNQYRVVLEASFSDLQGPDAFERTWFVSATGAKVPLSAFARWEMTSAPLGVNHQAGFPASTLSFNLPLGTSLSEAKMAIENAWQGLRVPASVQGSFEGTAKAFQGTFNNQPMLIMVAILTVYIVLGILYESLIHPLTILSTLPSAGVGALLGLMAFKSEFSVIALIGIFLLIGIVKKNAIIMIDFALAAQRERGVSAREAIREACLLRFRPIMMTTFAALFGAVPLALGTGDGAELRQPLGISIVGGLLLSQILTLYTTPVVYLYMERLAAWRIGGLRIAK
jgi:multidrug efflux pump